MVLLLISKKGNLASCGGRGENGGKGYLIGMKEGGILKIRLWKSLDGDASDGGLLEEEFSKCVSVSVGPWWRWRWR